MESSKPNEEKKPTLTLVERVAALEAKVAVLEGKSGSASAAAPAAAARPTQTQTARSRR